MLLFAALQSTPATAKSPEDWPMFGQNLENTANTRDGSVKDVRRLAVKWVFTTGGDVSARASVVDGVAYFPDWGGNLWAVKTKNGRKLWGHQLSDYGLPANTQSRTTPAVEDGVLYVGTQEGAWLLAIDAATGTLLWKTQLESPANDPFAILTTSPVVSGGVLYAGIASLEEGAAANPAFPCCKARGSVVAVDVKGRNRGQILWRTYTVPPGYNGGGVWGSNFVVDKDRGSLYVSTGNNYTHPTDPAYAACMAGGGTAAACSSPANHVDSILALRLNSGAIKWAKKFMNWGQPFVVDGSDDWNVACLVGFQPGQGNCPTNAGPDFDFASAPNLITYEGRHGRKKTILGAGQKSGIYFALDPDTGAELWRTQVGPGSALGGMEWGSASDGKRIYVSIANLYGIPTAVGGAGSWAALDPETGAILWQVGDPNGAISIGPLAVADGVVYVSSMAGAATAPTMLALSAESGQTLWSFASGASVNAGATIVDGDVFWGSGYTHLGIPGFTGNNKFYAFSKHGK
ncbi:MAG TPA: PQQ-binding-like beta-propeller repeat protein [Rhizobacter sp.]|nr:PQQ-binding-like beta-propeller repeat protein [Rhizobacter sp.]